MFLEENASVEAAIELAAQRFDFLTISLEKQLMKSFRLGQVIWVPKVAGGEPNLVISCDNPVAASQFKGECSGLTIPPPYVGDDVDWLIDNLIPGIFDAVEGVYEAEVEYTTSVSPQAQD